jgi:hypothetical protein
MVISMVDVGEQTGALPEMLLKIADNFDELIDYARTNPGKLSYASAGVGTVSSLSMQSIIIASRFEITAVPFAGGAQATMAVVGHHVDRGMVPYSTAAQMLRERKLRPLLTTASARLAPLPDTPTLSEGLPTKGFQPGPGLYAPQHSSQDLINAAYSRPAANHECPFGCSKARKRRPICSLRGSQNRPCAAGRRAAGYRRS